MAVAWQNSGYNQPPHISYYLPDFIDSFKGVEEDEPDAIETVSPDASIIKRTYYNISGQQVDEMNDEGIYIEKIYYSDGNSIVKKTIKK